MYRSWRNATPPASELSRQTVELYKCEARAVAAKSAFMSDEHREKIERAVKRVEDLIAEQGG